MKKLLAIVAVLLMAAPAVANDNLLSQLGLSGIQVVTADEASQVRGLGFVESYGSSSVSGGVLGAVSDGLFSSFQELDMTGIQQLMGAVTSAGSGALDDSVASGTSENGNVAVAAGSTVVGSAD